MKLFIKNAYTRPLIQNFVFDLENFSNYEMVSTAEEAEVVFLEIGETDSGLTNQQVIIYDWFHAMKPSQEYFEKIINDYPNAHFNFVSAIDDHDFEIPGLKIYFYDMLFNRTKAYYGQFPFTCLLNKTDHPWYYAGQDAYKINLNLTQTRPGDCINRIFVFCARLRKNTHMRRRIAMHLESYQHLGYYHVEDLNDQTMTYQRGLLTAQDDPLLNGNQYFDVDTDRVIYKNNEGSCFFQGTDYFRGYAPVHVNYYLNSFISFMCESLESGIVAITEKTWDPMIHGHFIVPFAQHGIIKNLLKKGFRMPDFIDYSYDNEPEKETRVDKYLKEITRLVKIDIESWQQLYVKNIDIIHHNQRQFWLRPYSTMTHLLLPN